MSRKATPLPGILDIAPYVGGKSSAAPGQRVIKLSSNESPLGASVKAAEAYKHAVEKLHRYPDGGATAVREAIASVHGLEIDRLVCGAGSDELIGLLIKSYAAPGNEVLFSEHGFLMYRIYTQAASAVPVTAPETDLTTSVDALLAKVSDKTRIVFVANPNNPTGTYLPHSELKRLREGLPERVLLVIDAAYAEYVQQGDYGDGRKLVDEYDNCVMLRTFSKIYALPALRIGWSYMSTEVAAALNRVRGPFNVSSPAIAAGAAAMQDTAFVQQSIKHNATWLPWLSKEVEKLGLEAVPSVGNFVLVHIPEATGFSAAQVAAKLIEQGIIVREVANYGLPDYLRITIGLEQENRALVKALQDILA